MNELKQDELSIYGEYARRAGRVTMDFFYDLFTRKIYAEDHDELPSQFLRTLARCACVRQRNKNGPR